MMRRRDLDERRPGLDRDPVGGRHEVGPDAPAASSRVDDEGEDPGDRVVVLEARHDMDGDEAEDLTGVLGDDDLPVGRREPLDPLGDDATWPPGSPRR